MLYYVGHSSEVPQWIAIRVHPGEIQYGWQVRRGTGGVTSHEATQQQTYQTEVISLHIRRPNLNEAVRPD